MNFMKKIFVALALIISITSIKAQTITSGLQPAQGVTLSGPLAGKTAYVLPPSINLPHCWIDSVFWDGNKLFYGVSSISFTSLIANNPAYTIDSQCQLPTGQTNPAFDIYQSSFQNGFWTITRIPLAATGSLAAPKTNNNQLAYVAYEKTNSYGNIYFTNNLGNNKWSQPVPFKYNTTSCDDDNPVLYSNNTKLIFESNRNDPLGQSCTPSHQKLWMSTFANGKWSLPVLLTGAPTLGNQVFQPWINGTQLYWTGNTICANNALNCVVTSSQISQNNWSNKFQEIISPTPITALSDGKVALVGQYSQNQNMVFFECAIVKDTDPTGQTPSLFIGRWTINMNICVIPLN